MNHQHPNMAATLTQERLCDFSEVTQAAPFTSFLGRQQVKEYIDKQPGSLTFDLTVLAAVEFGLVRLASHSDEKISRVVLPTPILPQDARLAIAKYDTTDTKPCETARRIIQGNIQPRDMFLFTGDLQKYLGLARPQYNSLDEGLAALPELLSERLNESAELIDDLLAGMWAEYQQLVWKLRLLVMLEAKDNTSREDDINESIRHFRTKWEPGTTVENSNYTTMPSRW
jgi:hypothetical protein